jgi:peptide/nickel transport system permease protein
MAGLQVSAVFGGTVLVETIFGLPGIGLLAYDAVFQRDYQLILGVLFVCSIVVVICNLVVDVVYRTLDPRIEIA